MGHSLARFRARGAQVHSYVARWSLPMRLMHWGLAVAFFGLLASGLALGNPDLRGIPFMGSKLVRELHLTWAVLLFVLPAVAAAWDGFRELRALWAEARRPGGAAGWRGAVAPGDRLNVGQRLNLLAVVGLLGGLTITGAVIAPEGGRPVPQAVREVVYEVHVLLAYATVPLVAGHLLLALVYPPTRYLLRGIILGSVRADRTGQPSTRWTASPSTPRPESPDACHYPEPRTGRGA